MTTLGATGGCSTAAGRPAQGLMGCRVCDPVACPTTGAPARSRERQATTDVPSRRSSESNNRLRRHDYVWRGPHAGVDRRLDAAPWAGPDRAQAAGMHAGYPVVTEGRRSARNATAPGPYFDTTDALGLMLEAVEPPTSMPPVEFVWPGDRAAKE